jgi:protein gp37
MSRDLFNPPAVIRPAEDLEALAAEIRAEHEAVKGAGRASVEHARNAGERLARIQDHLKEKHGWIKWLKERAQLNRVTAANYLIIYQEWDKCKTVLHLGVRGVLEYLRTGRTGEEEEDEGEEQTPEYVTLAQWNEMGAGPRKQLLRRGGDARFNDQGDNENIEWALWSWNPVTGCLHNCPYCYARDIANRFYDQKFAPSLWPGRLTAPRNTSFPEEKAAEWVGHKNVFTCSMADLFGRWVPSEWVEAVLAEARQASQWNFLFLTKFPVRMAEFDFPENAWVGTTVDCQARVANAEKAFRKVKAGVKWLSVEPMIEPLRFDDLGAFDWVVLGGASASSQTPAWHPPRKWVTALEAQAVKLGVRLYEKSNLWAGRIRQYPTVEPEPEPQQAPASLRYLPTDGGPP